jgi:hypothetical protein
MRSKQILTYRSMRTLASRAGLYDPGGNKTEAWNSGFFIGHF